jgi:hypothetical protein
MTLKSPWLRLLESLSFLCLRTPLRNRRATMQKPEKRNRRATIEKYGRNHAQPSPQPWPATTATNP